MIYCERCPMETECEVLKEFRKDWHDKELHKTPTHKPFCYQWRGYQGANNTHNTYLAELNKSNIKNTVNRDKKKQSK